MDLELDSLYRLIDNFSTAMKERLKDKYQDGWDGWSNLEDSDIQLRCIKNIIEGDAVDAANLAAFLFYNNQKRMGL